MKIFYIFSFLLLSVLNLHSQNFIWNLDFETIFDNREYMEHNVPSPSKTLFGAFVSPTLGIGFNDNHKVMVGVDLTRYFGDRANSLLWQPILYYSYQSKKNDFYVGSFQRHFLKGKYGPTFFSDDYNFYDRSIEGLLFQSTSKSGYSEVCLDWYSKLSSVDQEIISLYAASQYHFSSFFIGYNFLVNHYSWRTAELKGVAENFQFYPYVGIDLNRNLSIDELNLKLGYMQTIHRDRANSDEFLYPSGIFFDINFQFKGFGALNSFFIGDQLNPLYHEKPTIGLPDYADYLYFGDLFYNSHSGIYNRLELYWKSDFSKHLSLKFTAKLHFDRFTFLGWHQMATLKIKI